MRELNHRLARMNADIKFALIPIICMHYSRSYARKPKNFSEKYYCEDLVKLVDSYSEKMRDLAMSNTELFERYGSFYLAEPNTKWRGRELTDRIDY